MCLATGLKRKTTGSPGVPRRQTARLDGAGSAPQAAARRRVGLWLAGTQPIRRHKRSTCKPGSGTAEPEAPVSRLRIPHCREIRCKTQRVLGDSRALVKLSSTISGTEAFSHRPNFLSCLQASPHASAKSDLASPPPLLGRGEGMAFFSSVVESSLQGCPLPTSEHSALSATSSSTCRSSSKCLPHAPCWAILLKLPKRSFVSRDRHQEIIFQQSSSKRSFTVDYY